MNAEAIEHGEQGYLPGMEPSKAERMAIEFNEHTEPKSCPHCDGQVVWNTIEYSFTCGSCGRKDIRRNQKLRNLFPGYFGRAPK